MSSARRWWRSRMRGLDETRVRKTVLVTAYCSVSLCSERIATTMAPITAVVLLVNNP
jgi:hypothetical protein